MGLGMPSMVNRSMRVVPLATTSYVAWALPIWPSTCQVPARALRRLNPAAALEGLDVFMLAAANDIGRMNTRSVSKLYAYSPPEGRWDFFPLHSHDGQGGRKSTGRKNSLATDFHRSTRIRLVLND